MYILKNALKNIFRNRGRNILIGVILLGIITSTVVAFSINTTTKNIITNYKDRFGTEVTIARNMKKVQELMSQGGSSVKFDPITPQEFLKYGDSEYVKDTIYSSTMSVISKLVAIDKDKANESTALEQYIDDDGNIVSPSFKLIGNSNLEALGDFKSDQRKLIEGSIYKAKDECVISKNLADLNKIKVGDYINVSNPMQLNKDPIKLKVTGIYLDITPEYSKNSMQHPLANRRNEILCTFDFVNENAEFLDVDAKYFLKSPDMFESFSEELAAKGLSDIYEPVTDNASYKKIVEPIENLASITTLFIVVVLVLGSVILILLNTMSIRERKYEIGVLRAIGMKKAKVAVGLICESLVITSICLIIGLGIGALVAKPISNNMLDEQVKIYNEQQDNMWDTAAPQSNNSSGEQETITEIDVIVDAKTVAQVSGIAILLVLVSSLVGVAYITRYEPVKILTERG